jgi:uncharacterized protein YkwD
MAPLNILTPILLLLTLLLPYSTGLSIPDPPNYDPVLQEATSIIPVVPDPNDPEFVAAILGKINSYRVRQEAYTLRWDPELANYAAGLANQCDIESKVCSVT